MKPTPSQKPSDPIRDRALRIAERRGLCSVSSNTKWQRLLPTLLQFPCHKRIKFIYDEEPAGWQKVMGQPSPTVIEGPGGPEELKFVEWIEIERYERRHIGRLIPDSLVDHADAIRSALTETRATFRETDTSFVILGYTG